MKMMDWSEDIRHKGKSKEEVIKEVQRILLQNDFNVETVFETTKYMKDNLKANIEWILFDSGLDIKKENKMFFPKNVAKARR